MNKKNLAIAILFLTNIVTILIARSLYDRRLYIEESNRKMAPVTVNVSGEEWKNAK